MADEICCTFCSFIISFIFRHLLAASPWLLHENNAPILAMYEVRVAAVSYSNAYAGMRLVLWPWSFSCINSRFPFYGAFCGLVLERLTALNFTFYLKWYHLLHAFNALYMMCMFVFDLNFLCHFILELHDAIAQKQTLLCWVDLTCDLDFWTTALKSLSFLRAL